LPLGARSGDGRAHGVTGVWFGGRGHVFKYGRRGAIFPPECAQIVRLPEAAAQWLRASRAATSKGRDDGWHGARNETRRRLTMNLQKILVAIDFSPDSEPAIDAALELVRGQEAQVTLLHVCQPLPYSTPELGLYVPSPEIMADTLGEARRALAQYRARCAGAGATVTTALVTGSPAEAIVRYASEHQIDLIVIGSHGLRGFRRFILGSVAEAVVRIADRPVLTVRRPQPTVATAGAA
jgi:universal stress protein A